MVIVHMDGKNTSCIYPTDKISILSEPDDSEVEIMVPLSALTLSMPQATTTNPGPTTTTIDVSPPVVGSVTAGGDEIPIISWTPADAARMGISRETMSYLGRMDSARALGNIYDNPDAPDNPDEDRNDRPTPAEQEHDAEVAGRFTEICLC